MFTQSARLRLPHSAARPGHMADLLHRIATASDREAFRQLYQTYGPRVKAYMLKQGADSATAEELAQETLLTVWRKAPLFAGDRGNATTWIFSIARNLRIDRLRREGVWQELPQAHESIASDEPAPDEAVSGRQRQERVQAALAVLPAEQREVIELAYIEGLSHSEIAARLSIPAGTVKSRMRLAYDRLRVAVEDLN